jgi:hypothetical protein
MHPKPLRLALLAAGLLMTGLLQAAEASKEVAAIANKIFVALEKNEFEQFLADADNTWRRLERSEFDRLVTQLEPKMKGGYDVVYLGEIKRAGGIVQTLWKITLKANGEEVLANIDLKEGKVSRFGIPRI